MITKRQKEILDFLESYILHKGYAPSLEEIKEHFHLSSFSSVHYLVEQLRQKGFLKKENFKPRSIEITRDHVSKVKIPLMGYISAGLPIDAVSNPELIEVDKTLLSNNGKHYALKVIGNSMIDEGIFDGDTVIIKEQSTAENGEKVVALVNDNEVTLKKIFYEKGKIRLQPANPSFPPLFPENVTIQGKVVGIINAKSSYSSDINPNIQKAKQFQYLSDGKTTIFNENCLEVLREIKNDSIDLIFADPPYNLGKDFGNSSDKWHSFSKYIEWCQSWINECVRVLKPNGTFYVMNATQHIPYIDIFISSKIKVINRIVWCYDSSGVQAKNKFGSLYEPILMAVKDDRNYKFNFENIQVEAKTGAKRKLIDYRKKVPTVYSSKKTPGNVWYFPRVRFRMPEYEDHPSQKPELLLERIILVSSNPDDIVLDPFAGTFTTCAVAQKLNRETIGIEISEKYFKTGARRLNLAKEYKGEVLVKNLTKKTQNRNKSDHQKIETLGQLSFMSL